RVDRALKRPRVVGLAIAGGAEIAHVERRAARRGGAALAPGLIRAGRPHASSTDQAAAAQQHRSPDERASRYCTPRTRIGWCTGHRPGGPAAVLTTRCRSAS